MMQERERRRASVSTISGKRRVRSLPGRLYHPLPILAGDDSESIVLNLMQPQAAGRRRVDFGGEEWRDESRSEEYTDGASMM
jgi:hypothetical protein